MEYIDTYGLHDEVDLNVSDNRSTFIRHAAIYSKTTDTVYVVRAVVKKLFSDSISTCQTWIDGKLVSVSKRALRPFWHPSYGTSLNVDSMLRYMIMLAKNRIHTMDLEVSDHWLKRAAAIVKMYKDDFSVQTAIKSIYPQPLTKSCEIQVLSGFTSELVNILANILADSDTVQIEALSAQYDNVHIQFMEKQR